MVLKEPVWPGRDAGPCYFGALPKMFRSLCRRRDRGPLCNANGNYHRVLIGYSLWALSLYRTRETTLSADLETGKRHATNILLRVLQVLAAFLFGSSGVIGRY